MDLCESIVDGMRERLVGIRKEIRKIVEEGGKIPEKRFDFFSDPAELKLAAFYISVDQPYQASKMLQSALEMQKARSVEITSKLPEH